METKWNLISEISLTSDEKRKKIIEIIVTFRRNSGVTVVGSLNKSCYRSSVSTERPKTGRDDKFIVSI